MKLGKFFASLFVFLMSMAIIGGIVVAVIIQHYSRDLPDYKQLETYDPPNVTRLYAADGRLMAEYATEKRIFVPFASIPKRVVNAFIAAEDRNFYTHPGIDVYGLMRAIRTNIQSYMHGGAIVGGSTITQQVVKNFLLDDSKSLERKIREAILSFRITQVYSKDRILELYLNQIFLGRRAYGVAAAALNYFNKSLDELSIEEAAFLAALPKAPNNYDPAKFYARAKERRDYVVGRMLEDNYITVDEANIARAMPISLRQRDENELTTAEFFAEEVRRDLKAMYGDDVLYKGGLVVKTTLNPTLQKYADDALRTALVEYDRRHGYRGALINLSPLTDAAKQLTARSFSDVFLTEGEKLAIVTGMDAKAAQITFADGSKGSIPLEALLWARRDLGELKLGEEVRKPADVLFTGDVIIVRPLAMDKQEKDKEKKLEEVLKDKPDAEKPLADDGQYALRQIPAVNGAMVVMDPHTGRVLALSGGYTYNGTEFNRATQARRQPGSAIKPFVYLAGMENGFTPASVVLDAPVELSQGVGLPTWKPQNYKDDYLGYATLRVGLEKSRNAMTVRLAQMLGIKRVMRVLNRFHIYDDTPRNFSVVLGAVETTLLRLTNAYAMLVNGGKRVTPTLIERIDDRNGKIIFRRDTRKCEGCEVDPSTLVNDVVPPSPADNRETVVDKRVAYQMVAMLEGVVQRGTATRAKVIGKPLAGKTGTTNDSRDTWFIGFSPDLVAGVFIGFDKPESLGKKETGGSVALPGFVHFMQQALADKPSTPFRVPPGIRFARTGGAQEAEDEETLYDEAGNPITHKKDGSFTEAFITGGPVYIPPVLDKDGKPVVEEEEEEIVLPEEATGQDAEETSEYPTYDNGGGITDNPYRNRRPVNNNGGGIAPHEQYVPEMGTGGLY